MTRPRLRRLLPAALAGALAAACSSTRVDLGGNKVLQRMLEQPRYDVYQHSDFFADGAVVQAPPEGTIAREEIVNRPALTDADSATTAIPVPVTPQLLSLGETQFNIYCAACHGPSGIGSVQTALAMRIKRPANLQSDSVRALPPGQIYRVVTYGYRWMPPMAPYMDVTERWAVTAYLKTLQASYGAQVGPAASPAVEALRRNDAERRAESAADPRLVIPDTLHQP